MCRFTHLLLTRFNVRVDAKWSVAGQDPEWLRRRFGLFEQFCLPSVCGQTIGDFGWLVFFDSATPAEFRPRIDAYARVPAFRPVFIDRFEPEVVRRAIVDAVWDSSTHLITTRLDNDDAIKRTYLEDIQHQFSGQDYEFINFTRGLILANGRLYEHVDRHNAFVSLIAGLEPLRTVWDVQHTEIQRAGPVSQVGGDASWLQVVHGDNVSNRIRGRRRSATQLGGEFCIERATLLARDNRIGMLSDRLLASPVRTLRECAARVFKALRRIQRGIRRGGGATG